jgi:drug/metabolite transporter (DMT)-like permease
MKKHRNLATIPLLVVGGLIALFGVLLVLGAGGDNGNRADHVEVGGRQVGTTLAGGGALVLAAAVLGTAAALRRRSR